MGEGWILLTAQGGESTAMETKGFPIDLVHSPEAGGGEDSLDAVDLPSREPMTFAGTPPKIERGGKVFVTTDPAATTDPSETSAKMIAPAPIQLSRPMTICWSLPG
jgi:hypothetical protein